ncbi:hypothetical protein ZONE111904_03205 [Zobellia nedashkovskayae]
MILYERFTILYKMKQMCSEVHLSPNYSPLNRFFSGAAVNLLNFKYEGFP